MAPLAAAVAIPADKSAELAEDASTSRMWQLGHSADTASRSSDISCSHVEFGAGSGEALPDWLSLVKHPFVLVHAGRPYWER